MKNILLIAYQISPTRGSEYSVAWNYVMNMSTTNKITVVFGASGEHMGDVDEMNTFISNNRIDNVKFVPILPSKKTNWLNLLNRKSIFSYSFYLAYQSWHQQVYDYVVTLNPETHFDLIHFLNPIGYREPGYLWRLNLPYIWGPLAGANQVSSVSYSFLSNVAKVKFAFRSSMNFIQLISGCRIKKAMQRADVLLAATTENQMKFKKYFKVDSVYLPENAIVQTQLYQPKIVIDAPSTINFIWIGSIIPRKALIILLKSIALIESPCNFIVHIVGDGSEKEKMQLFAKKNQIDHLLKWHGHIPRNEVLELIKNQIDLHVITSLSEANTTVVLEMMAACVPTITLNHCGMKDTVTYDTGIKIEVKDPKQVVKDLAQAIEQVVSDRSLINKFSNNLIEHRMKYLWPSRVHFWNNIYDQAIDNFKKKQH